MSYSLDPEEAGTAREATAGREGAGDDSTRGPDVVPAAGECVGWLLASWMTFISISFFRCAEVSQIRMIYHAHFAVGDLNSTQSRIFFTPGPGALVLDNGVADDDQVGDDRRNQQADH